MGNFGQFSNDIIWKFQGPLFEFSLVGHKSNALLSTICHARNGGSSLCIEYDVKNFLFAE